MLRFWKKSADTRSLVVVLGSRNVAVLEQLRAIDEPVQLREASTTRGVYDQLGDAHLVVLDLEGPSAILEYEIAASALRDILTQHGVVTCTADEFLRDPDRYLRQARARTGDLQVLPRRIVCFTTYSGGVGKTTSALDTAVVFRQRTGLPVAALEFCYGASAFRAFTGQSLRSYLDVFNRQIAPNGENGGERDPNDPPWDSWKGISLIAMQHDEDSLLTRDQFVRGLTDSTHGVFSRHILSIIDVQLPHELFALGEIGALVDHWFVLMTARPDTVRQAEIVARDLAQRFPRATVTRVMNQGRRSDRLGWGTSGIDLEVPFDDRAEFLEGAIGKYYLPVIYPFVKWEGRGKR